MQRQERWKQVIKCTDWSIATMDRNPSPEHLLVIFSHRCWCSCRSVWCVCTRRAMKASRGTGSLGISRRALTDPFPNKFSGTNFLFLIITCPAAFLSPETSCGPTVQTQHREKVVWIWFFPFKSCCHKPFWMWKINGEEMRQLISFFFFQEGRSIETLGWKSRAAKEPQSQV